MMRKFLENSLVLLIGVLLGMLFGILFAPNKGINTRSGLAYQLRRYRNKLQELIQRLSSPMPVVTNNDAKTASEGLIDDVTQEAKRLLEDAYELAVQLEHSH